MVWEDLQSHGHEEPRQELHPGVASKAGGNGINESQFEQHHHSRQGLWHPIQDPVAHLPLVASKDLPGTAGRAQSPKRAQSAKRLSSASASLLPRSGSKGPKKATSGSVTFTTFEQLAPPPATQLATAKGPGMPVVYKDGAYPVRQLVVYSQHGASSPAGPVPKIGVVPGAPAPILVQSAAAVPSAPVPGAGTPRREAASGGGKSFNFCSECGTKFQASAKFCHECGVMRPGSEPCRLKFCHFCGARGSQWNVKTAAPRRL